MKSSKAVCYCSLCRPSSDEATIDVHATCCQDAHCAARRIAHEEFLKHFTEHMSYRHFSFTASLDGSPMGQGLLRAIAAGFAKISHDGFIRALGVIVTGADQ